MEKKLISVIIPGYNEEGMVKDTICTVEKILASIGNPFEIFVVDDASTDGTSRLLKSFAKSKHHPCLRYISCKDGPSRRENLSGSFRFLKGDYVVLLDMDLSMSPEHIREMVYWLGQGYDIVCPSRYVKGSKIKRNKLHYRYAISRLYNASIQMLFGTGLKDNVCGFKAFKRDVILRLVKEAGVDKTRTRSVFWDTEILIHARRLGFSIKQIPIEWKEGKRSALNFRREARMVPYIIRFWIRSLGRKG